MKKIILITALFLLIISGCTRGGTPVSTPSPDVTATPSPVITPAPTPESNTKTASGIYGGRADSNFIEVILDDGSFESLKLSDEVKASFDDINISEEDEIVFSYTEDGGVKTVLSIEKKVN